MICNTLRASGVYLITNSVNGKLYVGSSTNMYLRWYSHRGLLIIGKHHNPIFQNAWNKYTEQAFTMTALEFCANTREMLVAREQYWLDRIKPHYNVLILAGSALGKIVTAETRAKMRKSHVSRGPNGDAWRAKISAGHTGKKRGPRKTPISAEEHARRSASQMGRRNAYYPPLSEEHKAKIAAANRGKKCPHSADKYEKHLRSYIDRLTSDERADFYAKRGATLKATLATPEHKAKIKRRRMERIAALSTV